MGGLEITSYPDEFGVLDSARGGYSLRGERCCSIPSDRLVEHPVQPILGRIVSATSAGFASC